MPSAEPYGSGAPLVFDTSAWNRRTNPTVLPRWAGYDRHFDALCRVLGIESVWIAEPRSLD